MNAKQILWASLAGGLLLASPRPICAQTPGWPAGATHLRTVEDSGARVACYVGKDQKVISCEIQSGGQHLSASERAGVLARVKARIERDAVAPPAIVPVPTPPPPFQAVPREQRREYVGPPVIVPAPPPLAAPYSGNRPSVITNPQWLRRPDASDLERYYPPRARDLDISGRATIECSVTGAGSLTACSVVSESPAGMGFGEATVRAASKFRMRPRTVDGRPVEGARIRVTLVWNLVDPAPPPPVQGGSPMPNMLRKDGYAAPPILVPRVPPAPPAPPGWGSQPRPLGVQDGFIGEWNTERSSCGSTRRGQRLVITATTVAYGRDERTLVSISNPRPRLMVVETQKGSGTQSATFELTADGSRVDELTGGRTIQRFKCPTTPAG